MAPVRFGPREASLACIRNHLMLVPSSFFLSLRVPYTFTSPFTCLEQFSLSQFSRLYKHCKTDGSNKEFIVKTRNQVVSIWKLFQFKNSS